MKTLTELKELASQASPGPWSDGLEMEPPDCGIEASGGGCVAHVQCHGNVNTIARTGEEFSHADARYLAALDPTTVLAIIESHERLRAATEICKTLLLDIGDPFSGGHQETMQNLREALAAAPPV